MFACVTRFLIICQLLITFAGGSPVSGDGTSRSLIGGLVVFSVAILISILLLLLFCLEGGCWPLAYFRRRDGVAAAGMDNPISESSGGMGLSEIDVRALELDPIVFEPLPTLSDLTPRRRETESSHVNGKHLGAIVPFSSPESHIYAHDWFDEPFRNFPRGNIQYIREVGKGWFGQVIEGEARDIVPYAKKMRVVVKALRGDASDGEQMRFLDESRLYRDGNHGNILKLLGHSIETNPFLLLMEFCPLGDLKSYLIANVGRAEVLNSRGDVLRMALDVAKGLEWMAAADFTHGDLATRNCQVGSEGRILIGDYGLSTQNFKDDYYWSSNIAIPLRWAAPETLHCTINTIQTLRVTKESNVWTFGILLWELAEFGKLPYFELCDDDVISRVLGEKNYILGGPTMPSLLLREEIYSLMSACWSSDVNKRPSISSIVQRLQFLIQTISVLPSLKSDEFETKWENAPSQLRKKSVSFFNESPTSPQQPAANFVITTPTTPTPFAKTQIEFERREDLFPSLDLWKSSDPEEEDYKKRIERGEITQKVREKSESVQDLMILTHVEPSDLSDGDSLIQLDPSPPMGTLRRASSETAINSPGKGSSHSPNKITTNALILPTGSGIGSSPINRTGVEFRFIPPTPSPGIAINIVHSTPTPVKKGIPSISTPEKETQVTPTPKNHMKRRFVFRDEENHGGRLTSTPMKSPSPVDTNDVESEVFNFISEKIGNERSCQVSPISQTTSEKSIYSTTTSTTTTTTNTYSVSVFGAIDELGLEPFQGVTSTVAIPTSPKTIRTPTNMSKKLHFEEEPKELDSWTQIGSESDSWLVFSQTEGTEEKLNSKRSLQSSLNGNFDNVSSKLFYPDENVQVVSLEEKVKGRFQEEIAGANEEVGSLLFHDLEGGGDFQLIREDREEIEDGIVTPLTTRNAFGGEVGEESLSLSPVDEKLESVPFVPSKWNSLLNPSKSAIKSPETGEEVKEGTSGGIRKSVSFERKKRHLVYEYPPLLPHPDSDDDEQINPSGPLALSLDWELNPDEMEEVIDDDWDVESPSTEQKPQNPMDLYRISSFGNEGDGETPGIGGLRHTREKLKLDLWKKGEASVLENPPKLLDSGVGSTSTSPFSHCDNQPTTL